MVKRLLMIGLMALSPLLKAEVTAAVSQTELYDDETLTLTVRVSPIAELREQDIRALESLFVIEQSFQQTSRQIINGRSSSFVDHQFRLRPKQTGALGIPNFKVGNEQSQPIFVTVLDSTQRNDALNDDDVILTVTVSDETPYINQPIQLTIELAYKISMSQASLADVDLVDFESRLLDEQQTTAQINGQTYNVYRRFIELTPKQAGIFKPEDIRFSGEYANRTLGRYMRFSRKADFPAIQVMPVPANYPANAFWLPLTSLTINENLQATNELAAQEHLDWQIQIQVTGQSASLLPSMLDKIETQLPEGVKLYRNPPRLEDNQRIETLALSFSEAGTYTLPAIELPWWNVTSNSLEIARIPKKIFEVKPSAASLMPAPLAQTSTAVPADSVGTTVPNSNVNTLWKWIALTSLLGWAVTTAFFVRSRNAANPTQQKQPQHETTQLNSAEAIYREYLNLIRQQSNCATFLSTGLSEAEQAAIKRMEASVLAGKDVKLDYKVLNKAIQKLKKKSTTNKKEEHSFTLYPNP
jgi:hypothetical protein